LDTPENTANELFNSDIRNVKEEFISTVLSDDNDRFNYYVKNVKANFIEKVLSDDVEIINFDATHENWFEFDDIVSQIVNKILEDSSKKEKLKLPGLKFYRSNCDTNKNRIYSAHY
jgi:hypothetical protein